jgi:RNA polymerase-binding protein DksA
MSKTPKRRGRSTRFAALRVHLLAARRKIMPSSDTPAETTWAGSDPVDSADRENSAFYQLNDMRWNTVADIDRALKKIENGTYGVCEHCGKSIAEARLKALPFATLCVACKEKEEREGAELSRDYRAPIPVRPAATDHDEDEDDEEEDEQPAADTAYPEPDERERHDHDGHEADAEEESGEEPA